MSKLLDFFTESANAIEKTANADNGTIYNKKAFDAFIIDSYPENVVNGEIMPSKYENCAKKARKKLRNFLLQTLEAFLSVSDKKQKEKFAKEFAKFYAEFYKVNDYSVASVTNGKMKECTYHLYWQDKLGNIVDKWAFVANASSYSNGETGNATITLSANQFLVVMPKDEDTVNLRDTRMFIDNCTNDKPTPYKLTRPDNVSADYGIGNTYYIFTLDQRNDEKDKKVTLEDGTIVWIADYTTPTTPSNPENPDETVVSITSTISGNSSLKVGFSRTYSVIFMDKNGAELSDVNFTWNIVSDFNDEIVSTVNGKNITLQIDNEDYVDEQIVLQIIVDGTVNSELVIKIKGIF